jgi:hypothetical protein
MKSIRPLFRTNDGKVPECHSTFKGWVGDLLRGKPKPPREGRKLSPRKRTEVKNSRGVVTHVLLHPEENSDTVPCLISLARSKGEFLPRDIELLRSFLIQTLSPKTYGEWLESLVLDFFSEDDWSGADNHRKYALYVMACFVDFFRPGEIDWKTPNLNDMEIVVTLLRTFGKTSDEEKQRKLLRRLFDLEEDWKDLAAQTRTGLSPADRESLKASHEIGLTGEERARWLTQNKFKGFGMSPLTKFREAPDSFRALISKWMKNIPFEKPKRNETFLPR